MAKLDAATGTTAIVDHIVYNAFGKVISETDPSQGSLIGFTGRPFDKATGLQNNLHRWYDAATGQWISKDPIGFTGSDANTYCYCKDSTVTCSDHNGLWIQQDLSIYVPGKYRTEHEAIAAAEEYAKTHGLVGYKPSAAWHYSGWFGTGEKEYYPRLWEEQLVRPSWVYVPGPEDFVCPMPLGIAWEGGSKASAFISKYCKASINKKFPGQFYEWTLNAIEKAAKEGEKAAKTAYKLLKDSRFRK